MLKSSEPLGGVSDSAASILGERAGVSAATGSEIGRCSAGWLGRGASERGRELRLGGGLLLARGDDDGDSTLFSIGISVTFCHSRIPFCQASAARETLPLLNRAQSSAWVTSRGAFGPSLTSHLGCFTLGSAVITRVAASPVASSSAVALRTGTASGSGGGRRRPSRVGELGSALGEEGRAASALALNTRVSSSSSASRMLTGVLKARKLNTAAGRCNRCCWFDSPNRGVLEAFAGIVPQTYEIREEIYTFPAVVSGTLSALPMLFVSEVSFQVVARVLASPRWVVA